MIERGEEPASELVAQGARRASSRTGADAYEADREAVSGSKKEAAADSAMGDNERPNEEVAPLDERALLPRSVGGDALDEGIPPGILLRFGADINAVCRSCIARKLWDLNQTEL
eukprot:6491695-Amphidinium_carterae.2